MREPAYAVIDNGFGLINEVFVSKFNSFIFFLFCLFLSSVRNRLMSEKYSILSCFSILCHNKIFVTCYATSVGDSVCLFSHAFCAMQKYFMLSVYTELELWTRVRAAWAPTDLGAGVPTLLSSRQESLRQH